MAWYSSCVEPFIQEVVNVYGGNADQKDEYGTVLGPHDLNYSLV